MIEAKTATTATRILVIDRTPMPVDITACQGPGYSDEQFYADLKKASKKLDSMVNKALKEDARGKTQKFPI